LIDPYEPNDYRAIISDDWERHEKRRIKMIKRQGIPVVATSICQVDSNVKMSG
jgi:hypothetical protein